MKVIINNNKIITEFTPEQLEVIKRDLTFPNPKYHAIKKYSRYSFTSEPPFLQYYAYDPQGILVVPRGYEIPFEHQVVEDNRIEVYAKYPEFKLTLRKPQEEAVKAYLSNPSKGTIILPTGLGKSITALYIAGQLKQRTIIIVHKDDLIDGWIKDIELAYGIPEKEVGIIKGKKCRIGEQFTLATIQTLSRKTDKELDEIFSNFGLLVQDEQHHCPANSYQVLLKSKAKYFLGLTATDLRNDGLRNVIYLYFGQPCYRYEDMGETEDIMPFKVIVRNSNINYTPTIRYFYKNRTITEYEAQQIMEKTGIELKKAPINIHEIRKRIQEDYDFNVLVCTDIYKEYMNKKSCIVFCHEKEHVRTLYQLLIDKFKIPENKVQLYYGDAKEDDSVMKERAERKEVLITIATFSKATEGTNVKSWERAFLVTSLANEKDVIQAIGRVRRKKEGKEDVIVYDYRHPFIKAIKSHGVVRDRVYKKLGATVVSNSNSKILRGWKLF